MNSLKAEEIPADSRQARQMARRQMITEAVMAEGTVRIDDLTERFNISLMTVHRDLDELVSRGILRKSRGVVSAAPTSLMEASDVYRASRQITEKAAIAEAAMTFIEPGQAVFMDDATTVLQMLPHLAKAAPLTVITNSMTVMSEVKGLKDIELIGLGGQFHAWNNSFMGHMTTGEILKLRADTVFMSMAAIIDGSVFHPLAEIVEIKKAMMKAAARSVLLADHTKWDRRALHCLCPLTDFDTVIVDDGLAQAHIEQMRADGVEVVVAPAGSSSRSASTRTPEAVPAK